MDRGDAFVQGMETGTAGSAWQRSNKAFPTHDCADRGTGLDNIERQYLAAARYGDSLKQRSADGAGQRLSLIKLPAV
jgi:hypothetical protein